MLRLLTKYRLSFLILTLLPLLAAGRASAIPVPSLDLTELTKSADLIVVGQVTLIQDEGATNVDVGGASLPARQALVQLSVLRVLKGDAADTVTFRLVLPDAPSGYAVVVKAQLGMFFLREGAARSLVVANPYYPFVVAARDAPATAGAPMQRVTAELIHLMTSKDAPVDERVRAVNILDQLVTPEVTKALDQVAHESRGKVSLYAIAALLKRNKTAVLGLAEKDLLGPQQNSDPAIRRMLAYAIRDGVAGTDAIPALTRMLAAEDVEVRRSAGSALRHTGTDAAIEPLSKALRDSDREVRYQAVLGLGLITDQSEWAPSLDLFARDEQRYLMYWRDWLKVR